MIETLNEPFEVDGTRINIGASIGIALSPADGATPEELFGNADIALYRAKSDQRGTFRFFEAEMQASAQSRRTWSGIYGPPWSTSSSRCSTNPWWT